MRCWKVNRVTRPAHSDVVPAAMQYGVVVNGVDKVKAFLSPLFLSLQSTCKEV